MNKDVVYIEPEEDITDIISKIEGSKSKIVAIVPPKKAGVFKSIVNIKLMMKTGQNAEKTIVLVTTDPSIIKLAAATKIPVTKDLKSAPKIPELDEEVDDSEVVDVDDEGEEEPEDKSRKADESDKNDDEKNDKDDNEEKDDEEEKGKEEDTDDKEAKKIDDDDEDKKDAEKKPAKKDKKEGKLAGSNNPVLRWIGTHKKITAGIGAGLVLLIIVCIWAFGIAPAVTITLKLETTTGNFSENISFVDKLADEKVEEGKFYIEEKKFEGKSEVEFEATGKKNVGEKASGTLSVYAVIDKGGGSVAVNAGSGFSYSGLSYIATGNVVFTYDGIDADVCDNRDKPVSEFNKTGCIISKEINVQATEAGANYNISATTTGWATSSGVYVTKGSAMTGGTDKTITIVQQSDIDKAMKDITSENESVNKEKLLDTLADDDFPIESSFKQTVSDPVSTPAVGEEVAEGKKAKLTVTTTDTIFVIDETKLKEYIAEKAKLDKGYKIYEMNDPFVENFTKTDNGYVGKLKTSYVAGSTITENDIVETVKGKGIGTAKRDLTDNFKGIKSINFETSVPWVTSVPGDTNKITVNIKTEE
ncbi:hypothetical protein IKG24_00380 [Candidatus Saccharibacteria bacterium]|nr:hypothetical protein [Candidatus Saccharibacteria bacterium]